METRRWTHSKDFFCIDFRLCIFIIDEEYNEVECSSDFSWKFKYNGNVQEIDSTWEFSKSFSPIFCFTKLWIRFLFSRRRKTGGIYFYWIWVVSDVHKSFTITIMRILSKRRELDEKPVDISMGMPAWWASENKDSEVDKKTEWESIVQRVDPLREPLHTPLNELTAHENSLRWRRWTIVFPTSGKACLFARWIMSRNPPCRFDFRLLLC